MGAETYIIRGGREGRERLRLLSRVMWPTTAELFERLGLQADWKYVDAGCGGGDVSFKLAQITNRDGEVVGMDIDERQLEIARQEAQIAGLSQVRFVRRDFASVAADKGVPDQDVQRADESFDMLYSRFLLSHLPQPGIVLQQMRRMLKPGALIAVEDTDFRGHFCHPPNPAFDLYVKWFTQAAAKRGANANIGAELPALLQAAGFNNIQVRIVQPASLHGETKELSLITLENVADSIVKAGVADQSTLEQAIADLAEIVRDGTTFMSIPRVVQVWGRA